MPRPITAAALIAFAAPFVTLGMLAPSSRAATQTAITNTPVSAPAPNDKLNQTVQALHNQMDAAANNRDRDALMQFYSLEFTTADGLNRSTLNQAIRLLWQQYPQLNYSTTVLSAQEAGSGIDTETLTQITGKQVRGGREVDVQINVKSRQRWQDRKLVQQEILTEQTRISLGENPPTVAINLPETVKVGQSYNYDVIVKEPLEDDILLGDVVEQAITPISLARPNILSLEMPTILEIIGNRPFPRPPQRLQPGAQRVKLQRLRSGGFFKQGFAPRIPENRWLSAVLVRHDAGITIITQRLRVVEK